MADLHFRDYRKRLVKEGVLKSALCALIVGSIATFIAATVFWIVGMEKEKVWIVVTVCSVVFVVFAGASMPLFYFKKFQPTTKAIAQRVDALGLEERLITMTELEGDTSFIAKKQREDALAALKTVQAAWVKIAVSLPLIIAVSVSCVFGVGMTTVSVLAASEIIDSGGEIINPDDEPKEFDVVYEVQEGEGEIIGLDGGAPFQRVFEGDDALPVMAVPEDGYAFVEWSDGNEDPYRQDLRIKESMTIYAIFGELTEGDGEGMEGEGEGDEPADKPAEGEGNGQSQDQDSPPGSGAGGNYEENNQYLDGDKKLEDAIYDNAYEDAINDMTENGEYTEEDKSIIGGYFDSIKK